MAEVDTILRLGSSNARGLGAELLDVPSPDYERWFGIPLAIATADGYPATATMPGVRLWTCKQPFAVSDSRTTSAAGASTVTFSGAVLAATQINSWVFIQSDSTGQGNLEKITAGTGTNTLTVGVAWSPALAGDGTLLFFPGSHTVASTTINTITKENTTPVFTADVVGKFVILFTGAAGNLMRRVTAQDGAHTITLDDEWGSLLVAPTAGTGFCVLDGANTGGTLDGMATGAVLQPLQIHLNNAPVLLTGLDYSNYDQQCPVAAPTIAGATINADPEMFWQFRSRFGGTLYGVDINRDSATISPYPIGTTSRPLFFGWQHDTRDWSFHPSAEDSFYTAFITAVGSLRDLIEAEGNTMKVRAFVALIAENDNIDSVGGQVRYKRIAANLRLLRDAVREFVGDPRMPFIIIGPGSLAEEGDVPARSDHSDEIYADFEQEVMEDTYTELVDVRDDDRFDYISDTIHFDVPSQINIGIDTALAYDRIVDGNATTDVDICNLALSHIGESAKITALDGSDTSAQARHCARVYLPTLKRLLESHPWDFATRRIELVEVTNTRTEWRFCYEAPRHMAGAIAVLPPGAMRDAPTQPFIKEVDSSGHTVIFTDVEDAVIRFNRYVTNTRKFPASFSHALSLAVGAEVSGPIVKGKEGHAMKLNCLALLKQALGEAKVHDANQQKVRPEIEAPWMPGGEEFGGGLRDQWNNTWPSG